MSDLVEYKNAADGTRRRVHREDVDVVTRFHADGTLIPVAVLWRDGRSFRVDEMVRAGEFGAEVHGRRQARYRVRIGGHATDLYLEYRSAAPAMGEPASLRWWVFAYDQAKPGHAPNGA